MPCRRVFPCAFAVVLTFTALARAQTAPATTQAADAVAPHELTWKTDRLVIFKDGHGLVIKSGRGVADESGRAVSFDVPDAAVLGCFWAVGDGGNILGMRAEWVEERE